MRIDPRILRFLVVAAAVSLVRPAHAAEGSLAGVTIGQTFQQVLEAIGEPHFVGPAANVPQRTRTGTVMWLYNRKGPGIDSQLVLTLSASGQVAEIFLVGRRDVARTSTGSGLGDSYQTVLRSYGDRGQTQTQGRYMIMRYPADKVVFTLDVEQYRVVGISVGSMRPVAPAE